MRKLRPEARRLPSLGSLNSSYPEIIISTCLVYLLCDWFPQVSVQHLYIKLREMKLDNYHTAYLFRLI